MPRPDPPAPGPDQAGSVPAAAATASPWLRILVRSAVAGAAVAVVLAVSASVVTSPAAGLSVLSGAALVVAFFGISLVIGHVAGRTNPSGALGLFVVTYAIKVVGFAAVLFFLGAPGWLDRTWFFTGALATVIAWQVAEVVAFSRLRMPLYDDGAEPGPSGSGPAAAPPSDTVPTVRGPEGH